MREHWRRGPDLHLTARAPHRRAAHDHRRSAAMVADRNVFIVRQQRIVRPKHAPDVRCVKDRGVEIGVVADFDRHQKGALVDRMKPFPGRIGVVGPQRAADRKTELGAGPAPQRHQLIQRCVAGHVQDLIADPDSRPWRGRAVAVDAEGKILDRKVRVGSVGRFHPTLQRRIVRFIELHKR